MIFFSPSKIFHSTSFHQHSCMVKGCKTAPVGSWSLHLLGQKAGIWTAGRALWISRWNMSLLVLCSFCGKWRAWVRLFWPTVSHLCRANSNSFTQDDNFFSLSGMFIIWTNENLIHKHRSFLKWLWLGNTENQLFQSFILTIKNYQYFKILQEVFFWTMWLSGEMPKWVSCKTYSNVTKGIAFLCYYWL